MGKKDMAVRLESWMREEGINQTALSKKTGILQSVCHEIMSGGAFPSCGTIQRLAKSTTIDIRFYLLGK